MGKGPTTAMVLGAGLGQRMRPLTDDRPKPMVPFNGRPLIDHVIDRLLDVDVANVVVNVHYKADVLDAHLRARKTPKVKISDERDRLLDTGGGVRQALPYLGAEPFFIHNSDSVWIEGVGSNLQRMIARWEPEIMDSLLLLVPIARALGFHGRGDFWVDGYGRVRRRGKGEMAPFVFSGVSIAHPRLFDDAPEGAFSLNKLWDRAIESGRLYGVRLEGTWMHIGTPDALAEAERFLARESNSG